MGVKLDLLDLAVLDAICGGILSGAFIKMDVGGKSYFWIQPKAIINELPLLGINSPVGIRKRIDNLVEAGLVERCPDNEKLNRCYLAMGERYSEYVGSNETNNPDKNISGTVINSYQGPCYESIREDITTYHNTTDDNNPPISPRVKKPGKIAYADGVELTEKEYSNLCKDYGKEDADGMIQYLSSYKKERGYKTKDCNLTIRRWVADAYFKKRPRSGGFPDNGWVKILNGIHDGERTDYVDEQ